MHEGHRKRMKEKFILNGIDNFEPHEALELALFYAVPRRDTNELAHMLIQKCGSLSAVFDAPTKVLKEIPGIGESVAVYIKLIPEIARVYLENKFSSKNKNFDLRESSKRMVLKFVGRMEEVVAIMLFDTKGKTVYDGIISKGTVNAVNLYSRKIIELAVHYNAAALLLAHNHPSGLAVPSRDDLESTRALSKVFSAMKINFLDHIIVAENDYVSLKDCGLSDLFKG